MEQVHLEGFLVKRTIKSGRNWKRRYFVLDGTRLWYFRVPGETKARGELRITSDTFVKVSHFKPNSMELSTNRQVLLMCAETPELQAKWLHALEQSIQLARSGQKKKSNKEENEALIEKMSDVGYQEEESKSNSTSSASGFGSRAGGLFKRLKHRRRSSSSIGSVGSTTSTGVDMNVEKNKDAEMDVSESEQSRPGSKSSHFDRDTSFASLTKEAWSSDKSSDQKKVISDQDRAAIYEKRRPTHKFSTPTTTFEVDTRYSFIRPIGTGAYGVVVSANDSEGEEQVAIKKVTRAFEDLVDAKRILREIKLLRHFDHENVIHIKDLLPPRSYADFEDIYIVSELMETDLHRVIYSKQKLTEDHVQYFVYQTLRALKYIHSANVIHRDLKPSNLLLNSNCDLKVCDFGLARGLQDTKLELTEYVVTRWYRAPEIMLACREYTKAIDVWAVGCILAELLARKPLFPGEDYIHQLQLITDVLGTPSESDMEFITSEKAKRFMRNQPLRCKKRMAQMFPKASAECVDLLDKMLQFNPSKRITVEEALQHPYLESLHQPDDEPLCEHVFLFDDNKPDDQLRKRDIQDQILLEMLAFHPEERQRLEYEASTATQTSEYFPVRDSQPPHSQFSANV